MSKPILVSVFNNGGDFGGSLDIRPQVSEAVLLQALVPHRVSASANAEARTISVRPGFATPMSGAEFYKLIEDTLRGHDLLDTGAIYKNTCGSVSVELLADPVKEVIQLALVSDSQQILNIRIADKGATKEETLEIQRERFADLAYGIQVLLQQSIEEVATKFAYTGEAAVNVTEDGVSIDQIAIDLSPNTASVQEQPEAERGQAIPPRPRVDAPPVLDRSKDPHADLIPSVEAEKTRMRKVVDKAVEQQRTGPASVNKDDLEVNVLSVIHIHAADRENTVAFVIETGLTDQQRMIEEGIVTAIIGEFKGSVIDHGVLLIETGSKYLVKIRNVLDDYGIEILSLTPRDPATLTNDGHRYIDLLK